MNNDIPAKTISVRRVIINGYPFVEVDMSCNVIKLTLEQAMVVGDQLCDLSNAPGRGAIVVGR